MTDQKANLKTGLVTWEDRYNQDLIGASSSEKQCVCVCVMECIRLYLIDVEIYKAVCRLGASVMIGKPKM